jgi:hypothetical protein
VDVALSLLTTVSKLANCLKSFDEKYFKTLVHLKKGKSHPVCLCEGLRQMHHKWMEMGLYLRARFAWVCLIKAHDWLKL